MDASSAIAQSIDAMNQVLQMASTESIAQAEKLAKLTVEMAVGKEVGKGQNLDTVA